MRTFRTAAALAAAAVLLPGVAAAALPARLVAVTYDAAGTARLYALVNGHRRALGLPALALDTRLAGIARTWTLGMAASGDLAHNDALFTSATHALLRIKTFGENVAYASRGVDSAHQVLLDSPHHRENIESRAYAVAGFAVAVDAKGVTWVTEDFGSRPVAPAATTAPAPRPVAAPTPARAASTAARPAARAAIAARRPAPVAARPAAPAAPAYVPPAWPHRASPTDRVDPAATGPATAPAAATGTAAGAPRTATLDATRAGGHRTTPAATPLAAVATALAAATVAALARALRPRARRRSATLAA
ncbi:MAG TPA: CAP domain-containing protein [Mycobacteriales bacterium]|jgi:uncharacterized protein YkwD